MTHFRPLEDFFTHLPAQMHVYEKPYHMCLQLGHKGELKIINIAHEDRVDNRYYGQYPKCGDFDKLMEKLEAQSIARGFSGIAFILVVNNFLPSVLERRGFEPYTLASMVDIFPSYVKWFPRPSDHGGIGVPVQMQSA